MQFHVVVKLSKHEVENGNAGTQDMHTWDTNGSEATPFSPKAQNV